jgi:dephospho-CoA kinase
VARSTSTQQGNTVVGLTGGIGTGKTRVADLLRELGAAVECSDLIVRELQAPGGEGLARIVEIFGEEYLLPSGELNREKLGELVFKSPEARRTLGPGIIHPLVYQQLSSRLAAHRQAGQPVIVLDIPLLLEGRKAGTGSGAGIPFDVVAVVYANEPTQVERVIARDGLDREAALARVRSQMPIEEKREMADALIDNSEAWDAAEKRVRELYADWARLARS